MTEGRPRTAKRKLGHPAAKLTDVIVAIAGRSRKRVALEKRPMYLK